MLHSPLSYWFSLRFIQKLFHCPTLIRPIRSVWKTKIFRFFLHYSLYCEASVRSLPYAVALPGFFGLDAESFHQILYAWKPQLCVWKSLLADNSVTHKPYTRLIEPQALGAAGPQNWLSVPPSMLTPSPVFPAVSCPGERLYLLVKFLISIKCPRTIYARSEFPHLLRVYHW